MVCLGTLISNQSNIKDLYTALTLTGTLSGDRFLFRLNQFSETLRLVIEASDNSSPVSLDKNDLFYPCI